MLHTPDFRKGTPEELARVGLTADSVFLERHEMDGYVYTTSYIGGFHTDPQLLQWHPERAEPLCSSFEGWCGVCDSVEQFDEALGRALREDPRKFVVFFIEIRKEDQPEDGGWRWCKWGEYIGKQTPTRDYLHDEPVIETVYVFMIFDTAFHHRPDRGILHVTEYLY